MSRLYSEMNNLEDAIRRKIKEGCTNVFELCQWAARVFDLFDSEFKVPTWLSTFVAAMLAY